MGLIYSTLRAGVIKKFFLTYSLLSANILKTDGVQKSFGIDNPRIICSPVKVHAIL